MAKLGRRLADGRWRVSVNGWLGVADLRRLERACAPALEHRPLPLDLQLDAASGLDRVAHLFLESLLLHGAAVVGERAAQWREVIAGHISGPGAEPPASSSLRGASSVSAPGAAPRRHGR